MPNGYYQSSFTGEHNDEYDSRINAKVSKTGDTMTGTLAITNNGRLLLGDKTLTTYTDVTLYRKGTNDVEQTFYFYNSANGEGSGIARKNGDTTVNTVTLFDNYLKVDNILKITKNNNTVTIGSQNEGFCHIYNSESIPFIFNNTVASTNGVLGTSSYPWKGLILSSGAQVTRQGTGSNWIKGRDTAIVKMTTCPTDTYCATVAIATGSAYWCIGSYNSGSWAGRLAFTYGTNTNYNNNSNTTTSAYITTAGAFTNASKRELKENIKLVDYSCLDIINSIQICSFNMKGDDHHDYRVGFIADDTDPIVSGKDQDVMDLQNCIGVLIKAVQELSQEVEELKKNQQGT